MMTKDADSADQGQQKYEQQYQYNIMRNPRKRAQGLELKLVPNENGQLLALVQSDFCEGVS